MDISSMLQSASAGGQPPDDGSSDVEAQLSALDDIEEMLDQARQHLEAQGGAPDASMDDAPGKTPGEEEPGHDIAAADPTEPPGATDEKIQTLGTGRLGSGKSLFGKMLGR